MTSDSWRGDVAAGVDAWTRRAEPVAVPPDPAEPPEADQESVARKILLDQLTGRARSRQELADRLRGKHVPDEVAARLLDRFEEVGLVDDAAFARAWVTDRHRGKGLAPRALQHELRRKGVEEAIVHAAVGELTDDDQESAARTLVRRRLRSLRQVDGVTARRRLAGMLARKGYPSGLCYRVVEEELAADVSEQS